MKNKSSDEMLDDFTRCVPFIFSDEVDAFNNSLTELTKKTLDKEQAVFMSPENVEGYTHGVRWQSYNSSDPGEVKTMERHEHEVLIKFEEIVNNNIDAIPEYIQLIVQQMTEAMMMDMYSLIQETSKRTGNVVSATEEVSHTEAFLNALEMIEFGVDREGNPTFPDFHTSPQVAEKLLKEASSLGPEFELKVKDIRERKVKAALEREQQRLDKFKTDDQ